MTPHFTIEEATFSDTAMRLGIKNVPPEPIVANIRKAAEIGMEPIRQLLNAPVRVHSWFRCEALEKVLCRKDYARWCVARKLAPFDESGEFSRHWATYFARKAHPQGWAIDWSCPGFGSPAECARAVRDSGIKFDQLILEGTWVHTSFAPAMRRQILSAAFDDGTPSYSMGIS